MKRHGVPQRELEGSQETRAHSKAKMAAAYCIVGLVAIGVTLILDKTKYSASHNAAAASTPAAASEDFGYQLMAQTPELIGPDVPDSKLRYTGNRLSCVSCHVNAGDDPGALNLFGVIQNYPKFSARSATIRTLEDRINECMVRSMNGRPLPRNSPQIAAMATWARAVAVRGALMNKSKRKAAEPLKFQAPDRSARVYAGKQIFEQRCATCHGYDGLGILVSASPIHGYIFPPVWGADSFNTGAGMHRLLTAAAFVKARMPLGRPDLPADEA